MRREFYMGGILCGRDFTEKWKLHEIQRISTAMESRLFLLVAETHYTIAVCADRMKRIWKTIGDDLEGT